MLLSFRKLLPVLIALLSAIAARCAFAETGEIIVKFVVGGKLPPPAPINQPKDFETAGLTVENAVVGADDALANVVIYVRTKDVPVPAEVKLPAQVVLDNRGGRFEPRILPVWVGKQQVVLKNSDAVGHNVKIQPLGNPPKNALIPGGGQDTYDFVAPCSLPSPAGCNIHPWMQCYLVAKDNPYVGVSGKDGKLTIKGLPVGIPLEFQVWHEKPGYLEAQPTWPKGRFTLEIKPGTNDLGVVKVPAGLLQ